MAGGGGLGLNVGPDELLWRFIDDIQYQPDHTGKKVIQQGAFVGQISLIRPLSGVNEAHVDAVRGGKFAKSGIAVLKASEIANATKGSLLVTADTDWPTNAHVLFIRATGGKNVDAKHAEAQDLTDLANQRSLLRPPKP